MSGEQTDPVIRDSTARKKHASQPTGDHESQPEEAEKRRARRDFLRAIGTGGVLIGSSTMASGKPAGEKSVVTSVGAPTLDPGGPGSDVTASPDFPMGTDELVVFCGGYGTNPVTWNPEFQAATAEDALEADAGVTTDVVAYDYDLLGTYWSAKAEAAWLGVGLADWIDAYLAEYPETEIRLFGHSLGAQVVVHCLDALERTVASAGSLLGGVATTAVTVGGEWYDAIANYCEQFNNYYDVGDLVSTGWALVEFAAPLARNPADGVAPANYTDHDVTTEVEYHLSAFDDCDGCMDVVATQWGYDVEPTEECPWWDS
jgi:pimeloyl-ACP methyl ester carboxylesterase